MINKKVYEVLLVGFRTIFPVYSHKYNILDQLCKLKASVWGKTLTLFFLNIQYLLFIISYISTTNKQNKTHTGKKNLDPIQCRKIVFYSLKLNMFVFIKYPRFFSLPRKQHEMRIKKDFVKMRRSDIWHCAFILWKNINSKAAYIYG